MAPSKPNTSPPPPHATPITIPPLSGKHTSTLILLHGRGSNAPLFSAPLLSTPIPPSNATLAQLLPQTKFVFPTASFRRATFANRARITQWFDTHRLDALEERVEVAVEGLSESVRYLHGLVADEAAAVEDGGVGCVVVGGLSQGSSTTVTACLTWTGDERLGAVVGLAGWLPLGKYMVDAMEWAGRGRAEGEDSWDGVIFEDCVGETTVDCDTSPADAAIGVLREELGLSPAAATTVASVVKTPIFLGHGTQDEKVPVRLGRQAAESLRAMGCDVTWREYDNLGHWYHGEQLADVVRFLRHRCPNVHVNEA